MEAGEGEAYKTRFDHIATGELPFPSALFIEASEIHVRKHRTFSSRSGQHTRPRGSEIAA